MHTNRFILFISSSLAVVVFIAGAPTHVFGQVVHLPSYRSTGYSGAVLVPDGGTAVLGGNSYGRWGSRGVNPMLRSSGSSVGTAGISANVQIIDLKALDDAILSGNLPASSSIVSAGSPAADGTRNYLGPLAPEKAEYNRSTPGLWQRTMAGETVAPTVHPALAESNIRYFLLLGKQAENAGRISSSRVYYRMALNAMTPEILSRYNKLLEDRKAAEEAAKNAAEDAGRKRF